MAGRTYTEQVIVLRKTRLREADVILTMLAQDGRQVRAVAKGALKPTGSFASRLELYAESSVLFVEGRALDIVKEARLVNPHAPLRFEYERSICAAPVAELLAHATQDELPVDRLFPMTQAALGALEHAREEAIRLHLAAFLLKAASLLGFRPSLRLCAECGMQRSWGERWSFSHASGGVLCDDCAARHPADAVRPETVDWADALIHATFAQVDEMEIDARTLHDVLLFAQAWIEHHMCHLKSLPFVLSER